MKFDIQKFGAAIRLYRGERNLRDMGKEFSVSASTLSRIENGNMPDVTTFCKILVYTGWNFNEYLTNE